MNNTIPKFFREHAVGEKIISHLDKWRTDECLHDPLAWRKAIPELASLGYKGSSSSQHAALSARSLMEAFRFFGSISLDLRDVPGLGHVRIFLASKKEKQFNVQLSNIASAKSFAAICITEEDCGSDLHAIKTTATRKDGGYAINGQKKIRRPPSPIRHLYSVCKYNLLRSRTHCLPGRLKPSEDHCK